MHTSRYTIALVSALTLIAAGATTAAGQTRTGMVQAERGHRLSGTYQLDSQLSDNPRTVVDYASQALPPGRRERAAENWLSRLDAPATIAIDVRGRAVTLMSSSAPQVSFQANGVDRVESGVNGRSFMNAALRDNSLVVSTSGNRGSDFTVTFEPVAGGLRVTRRLDSDVQQTSVVAESFYRRVGDAQWNVYQRPEYWTSPYTADRNDMSYRGAEFVPNGTRLVARLDIGLNADAARAGDRVTLTVQNSGVYLNAVIDGIVTRDGSNVGLDFENIRLGNGRSATFDAVIDTIRTPDGTLVRVNNSAIADERDRSTSGTVEKGAIGAGIGAIIGAIVGGKKGAVIGAVAGGAGLILMDTKTDQKLPAGTEFTISTIGR